MKAGHRYHIGGIEVEFPYEPYGSQLAFMGRVISTLERAVRDGHCHALLESPTGTGKSLSLLCSVLAWQKHFKFNCPAPRPDSDPYINGGGFIPPPQSTPSSNTDGDGIQGSKLQKKKSFPTIFYSSRTHSQLSQVIREYRKTDYRVPMAVLGSRKHYCTNPKVNGRDNVDEECKLLLDNQENGCFQYKNVHKVKSHPSLQKGGCNEVHDIEDLVKVGEVVKGCSYFASRAMAEDAHIVFCPYNYIVSPVIRRAMSINIKGAIIILDEAHNIEDVVRDCGSMDVEDSLLERLKFELEQLSCSIPMIYQPLYEMVEGLENWIQRKKDTLGKRDPQHYITCWTGENALKELLEANISETTFPIFLECATKAIKAATDTDNESELIPLSGMSLNTLEGLMSTLTFFFSRNGSHTSDYQLALQRHMTRDKHNAPGDWVMTLSLWCMNPAVVFTGIADLSLSIILTSGTLSPMNSFSSELGVQFGTCLDAPHVVDIQSQVLVSVVSTGSDNYPINASYKTADSLELQDSLGTSIEEICKVVPAGSLIFFPSYKLMEKMCSRWKKTGQWSRINARKPIFTEPRGGSQEDLDSILKDYYKFVTQGTKTFRGKKRRVKKATIVADESCVNSETKGAAFLAVCRGKVSEGIDFSDDYARVVIIVGIPFPNINDIQVTLKKKYNDTYKASKNLLSGDEWYCHQAFRALNQAAGRCIRHRFDYGAIILLDERYKRDRNRMYISKWLRSSIKLHDSFDTAVEELNSFFKNAKENVNKATSNLSKSDVEICSPLVEQCKAFPLTENPSFSKSPSLRVGLSKILNSSNHQTPRVTESESDVIDSECNSPQLTISRSNCDASPDEVVLSVVNETPTTNHNEPTPRPVTYSETGCSGSIFRPHGNLNDNDSIAESSFTGCTPEKEPFNLSVNNTRKRRIVANGAHDDSSMPQFKLIHQFDLCADNSPDEPSTTPTLPVIRPAPSGNFIRSLRISCARCKAPFGLSENHLQVKCTLNLSSKVHLLTLVNDSSKREVSVLMTDKSSVNQRICVSDLSQKGVWSEVDGCVFKSLICPFCRIPYVGVEVLATDASNTSLLNKVILLVDRLEIQGSEMAKNKENSPKVANRIVALNAIEKFSYTPKSEVLGDWRTTKSKVSNRYDM